MFAAQIAKVEPLAARRPPESRVLAYLMREVPAWRTKHSCGSCHNNGDGARALFRAMRLGHDVPRETLANTRQWLSAPKDWEREAGEPGTSDRKLARLQFAASLVAATEAAAISAGPC